MSLTPALTSSNVAEDEYGNYSSGATYALGDRDLQPGHARCRGIAGHANLGQHASDQPVMVVRVGPTNRMAMF